MKSRSTTTTATLLLMATMEAMMKSSPTTEGIEPLERVVSSLLPLGLLLGIQRIRARIKLFPHFRIK